VSGILSLKNERGALKLQLADLNSYERLDMKNLARVQAIYRRLRGVRRG